MSPSNPPPFPLFPIESPWQNNANNIWLCSTLSLSRNIEKFDFPDKLSLEKRQQIMALLSRELLKNGNLKNPRFFQAENLLPIQKEYLVEHFLSDQGFHHMHEGEGFLIDESGKFLSVMNLKNHLYLHVLDLSEEIESAWSQLAKIEMELDQTLDFAFSPKFGFLTSNPAQCGTALIVHIFLHIPALLYTNRFHEIMENIADEGVEYSGIQGNPDELIGDVVSFRNTHTLGVKEEGILSSMRTLATKLLVEEKGIRSHLNQESESELSNIKDKVSRAYAILLHSYQIKEIEALESLSLVKLGLDLGWIKGVSHADLNHLLFSSRQAHVLSLNVPKTTSEALPHERSEFIHKALKGLELMI